MKKIKLAAIAFLFLQLFEFQRSATASLAEHPVATVTDKRQYSFEKDGVAVKVSYEKTHEGHWFKVLITDPSGKELYSHEGINDAEDVKANFLDVNGDGLMDVVLEYSYEDATISPMILVNDNNQRFVDSNPKDFPLDIQGLDDDDDKTNEEKPVAKKKELYWVKPAGKEGKPELIFKNLMFFDKKTNSYTIARNVSLFYNKKAMCFEAPPKYLNFMQNDEKQDKNK